MLKINTLFAVIFLFQSALYAQIPEYSKAGSYELTDSGREVFDFNVGWRFLKGAAANAESPEFDDSGWELVSTPHTLELTPVQASGGANYQGEAWYRKHFSIPENTEDKRLVLHFEAVMGKCKVWVNGKLLASHFGGYLPFSVDMTHVLHKDKENVIAVWADNSDDSTFPPGKPQKTLDFTYFGGIYRDVWLLATNAIYITDPNETNKVAGGGVFTHFEEVSAQKAAAVVQVDMANTTSTDAPVSLKYKIKNANGEIVAKAEERVTLLSGTSGQYEKRLVVAEPELWSPDHPYLYDLEVVVERKGTAIDGVRQKLGIRKIEFKGKDGLYLNNKPYPGKLMGANRHQDYAYIGNALPNSGQWRDALLLKEAGVDIIRAAHYPADPAFMDACDHLGIFFIVATPGWQFWNHEDKIFEERVYADIRNMVRRDRNHASVLMWEPILNETHYPDYFAQKVHNIVHEEYPFDGVYTVCDAQANGQEYFDVVYSHPFKGAFWDHPVDYTPENANELRLEYSEEDRAIFTREWGDCVDDWNSHNSPSRAARGWGETTQLIQANHYAKPDFIHTSWEALYDTPAQHVGGALWHAFDHQRGYHPDPFYGGITDAFRQPKYSYYLFKSQLSPAKAAPMVYIAHEMTPFSPADVTVFTNCDEVRLIRYEKDTLSITVDRENHKMPSPVVVFKDAFRFIDLKALHRSGKSEQASFVVEGLIDGEVVARTKKMAALRPAALKLELTDLGIPLTANGSDVITVIASVVDENGQVKRLNNEEVKFEIEGEGAIVGDAGIMANPVAVTWGTAPVLIRSTTNAGTITVKASVINEGINTPRSGEIHFQSVPSSTPLWFDEHPEAMGNQVTKRDSSSDRTVRELKQRVMELEQEMNRLKLKEVEKQQQEFEGGKN